MARIQDRLGRDLALDTAHVLLGYPIEQIRRWAADNGLDPNELQNDLIRMALEDLPAARLIPLYDRAKYRATTVSVVWFRGIPRPGAGQLRREIPPAPYSPRDLPQGELAFVFATDDDEPGELRARLAYRQQERRAVQHGLGFIDHSPYGYVTLLWRPVPGGEVVEVWTNWQMVTRVHDLLVRVTGINADAVEVLDVTTNEANDGIEAFLEAQLAFSRWRAANADGGDPVGEEAAWAAPGRSLTEAGSSYVAQGRGGLPSISRILESTVDGTPITLKVSTKVYSVVLWPGTPTVTRRVLEGAINHGTWRPFSDAPRPDQGVRPRPRGRRRN